MVFDGGEPVPGASSSLFQENQALFNQCLIVLLDCEHQTVTLIADCCGRSGIVDHRHNQCA